MTSFLANLWTRSNQPAVAVARGRLQHLSIKLPPLKRKPLAAALRLQLISFMPPGVNYAFVYQPQEQGEVQVWAWSLQPDDTAAGLRRQWPEPLLEAGGEGLRLVARGSGAEAQHWHAGRLRQTRWWQQAPHEQDWERFVRAAGEDPEQHPQPKAQRLDRLDQPDARWLRGDSLPTPDPWAGWRWQTAGLITGAVLALALGAHLQTRQQLAHDRTLAAQLRTERETALTQRAHYQALRVDYEALSALAPKVSQLELLDKVVSSGILTPVSAPARPENQAVTATPGAVSAPPPGYTPPAPVPTTLAEWDYRNGQLKLSLDIPEGELAMLDTTRRIEKLPAFSDIRIGLESSNTSLSLNMRVVDATSTGAPR